MKKTFLIAGLIAGLTATNGYADIVISQTDENPDTIITVARATKTKPRVAPKPTNTYEPVNTVPGSTIKVSSGFVAISCPDGCKAKCWENQANGWYCECQTSDGHLCEESVITDATDVLKLDK